MAVSRMDPVVIQAKKLRILFEVEYQFVLTASTIIYRVGDPELKYRLSEHVWEAAQHTRFLRERGRELSGFGRGDTVRPSIARVFEEVIRIEDGLACLAVMYRTLKPGLLRAYEHYLAFTEHLGDWPTTKLVEEFIRDDQRHAEEIAPYIDHVTAQDETAHIAAALAALGGWLGQDDTTSLPNDYRWASDEKMYTHAPTPNRGKYPTCGTTFGYDPGEMAIVRPWLTDPETDTAVLRIMVYVWLMNEMDAVDYLATVFYDTQPLPFDMHFDMARHLWDESRHSQFGFRQLPRLGIDLMTVEQQVFLYDILVQMAPHERYAMMTHVFEASSFDPKGYIMDRVRELNDFEMDTLLAFDRSDEQNHVRYGSRWLPVLLDHFGETRPVAEWLKEVEAKFAAMEDTVAAAIGHTLPPNKRLTGNSIREFVRQQA
jgi:uncharacterized ferritin-like protein (DUF455 family)